MEKSCCHVQLISRPLPTWGAQCALVNKQEPWKEEWETREFSEQSSAMKSSDLIAYHISMKTSSESTFNI